MENLQLRSGRGVALTPANGDLAVLLDHVEQRVAALLEEHFSHHRPERMHVVAQRLVLRGEVDQVPVQDVPLPARPAAADSTRAPQRNRPGAFTAPGL
jgi:hypothetical protein